LGKLSPGTRRRKSFFSKTEQNRCVILPSARAIRKFSQANRPLVDDLRTGTAEQGKERGLWKRSCARTVATR
jgi:hypothetical protein